MNQVDLMVRCKSLAPGQCFNISNHEMTNAAHGCIKTVLLDGPPRAADVNFFVEQIRGNWGVSVTQNPINGQWTICRDGLGDDN